MEVNCTHRVPAPCELCVFYALKILKANYLILLPISEVRFFWYIVRTVPLFYSPARSSVGWRRLWPTSQATLSRATTSPCSPCNGRKLINKRNSHQHIIVFLILLSALSEGPFFMLFSPRCDNCDNVPPICRKIPPSAATTSSEKQKISWKQVKIILSLHQKSEMISIFDLLIQTKFKGLRISTLRAYYISLRPDWNPKRATPKTIIK